MNIDLFAGFKSFLSGKNKSRKRAFAILMALFVITIAGALFLLRGKPESGYSIPKVEYANIFALTSDKISQSANIAINLPPNLKVTKEEAQKSVEIFPAVKGIWIESGSPDKIVFSPERSEMRLGRYYSVLMKIDGKTIGSDFLVVDDPKVLTVFPKKDSETNEESEITVMFNRPMVPITTLDVLESFDIPIEITPKTEGKFKWIGTRTLQFIPTERLVRSSNYDVKVRPEFYSLDGLNIEGFESQFKTRVLRYNGISEGITVYSDPVSIDFNQPVDLARTAAEIKVMDLTDNKEAEFIAEYGYDNVYNKETKKYDRVINQSRVFVYNKFDQFGREKLWDFKNSYRVSIARAYPQEGDINLEEPREAVIQVTDIISGISATSDRSSFTTPTFFDSQGKLWIEFYEDIDLTNSVIDADKKISMNYGEKCKEDADQALADSGQDCEKETDLKKIYFTFDSANIKNYDVLKIYLNAVKNTSGLVLNNSPIIEDINVIPDLRVLSTVPGDWANGTSLNEFVICANSPINSVSAADAASYLNISPEYEFRNWQNPVLVPEQNWGYYICKAGEFETRIGYRLMPETDYSVEIKAVDNFSRETVVKRNFKTGPIPEDYLNFFHYQQNHNVTTPDKTKLTYAVENMDYVDMNICEISAETILDHMSGHGLNYTSPTPGSICDDSINKKITLPKKYWIKNYFKIDLGDYVSDPMGHYILTFSNPKYRERWGENRMVYERTYLSVTNMGIVEKKVEVDSGNYYSNSDLTDDQKKGLKNVYWVTDMKTLGAIEGANIQLYSQINNLALKKESSFVTNGQGIAEMGAVSNLSGAIVTKGSDSTVITGTSSYDKFQYGSTAMQSQKIYMYTDRPIYKPLDEVNIKGLYRLGYDANYEIIKDSKMPFKIYNSKGEEIFNQDLDVNDFGTFNTKIILDEKSPLGTYRMDAKGSSAFFDVEEYVPAPFKVDVISDKEEYVSKDTMNLNIDASYYFGAPLEGGEVEYELASQDYYFDRYQDEYFNFGMPWYYCYWDCSYGNKFILRSKASLDQAGKAKISYNLDLEKIFKDEKNTKSKIIVAYITVKNRNGQSVSSQKSFIVHKGDFYLGISASDYFVGKNQRFDVKVKSVDTMGKNVQIGGVKLKVSKVEWVQNKRQEVDGGYYNNWERKLTSVSEQEIGTDQNGNWKDSLSLAEEGEYELTVSGQDAKGNSIESNYNMYVYGEAQVDVRVSNDNALEMITAKNSLKVGDQGEIVIKSPYERAKVLISIERGKIFDYKIIDVNQNLFDYKFDILPEYIPNFFVTAILISPDPEVRFAKLDFQVDTEKKELDISAKTNKTEYLPGEEVTIDFESKDFEGRPAETEFSVSVADLSVLALKGNPKKNPVVFFYGGFPLTISTSSSMKDILYEVNVPGETKGGGGGEPEDLAKKKRGEFKDTAFWQAVVVTDADGKAQVKFKLPDNLTSWQVESIGITKDTKLGVGYSEFTSRKDLMVVPLKPRFAIPGDEFMIGAKIFNQTNNALDLSVSFSSETLALKNDQSVKDITLAAKESNTIYFNVAASSDKQDGTHTFTLAAKSKDYEDTVENTIKVARNETYEATATSGYSKDPEVFEFSYLPDNVVKDRGEMTIKTSATLAVFISDALNYLLGYPYGCSEQVASKLDSIAVVKRGLNLKNIGDKFNLKNIEFDQREYTVDEVVDIGLSRLYLNQKGDGSFGYYPDSLPNVYLTLHVASTIKSLKDAGYAVNEDSLRRSFNYINNKVSYDTDLQKDRDFMILAFGTLTKLSDYGKISDNLTSYIKAINNDDKYLNEEISNTSLVTLASILVENEAAFGKNYKAKVFNILENRIDIDSRGAFLPPAKNVTWQYYATPIKDTAMLLKVLVEDKKDNEILDRLMRWLLRSRSKDGAWGSTNNTLSVIDAFTDYINWQKENESNFDLTILLDGVEKQSFGYTPETVLSQNSLEVPVGEMKFGSIGSILFRKKDNNELNNNFYYDISLKYFLPINQIPPRDEGFTIERDFFAIDDKKNENPIKEAKVGDVLRGHIKLLVPAQRNFVSVEDFIPAGTELVNFNLATEDQSLIAEDGNNNRDNYWWDYYNDGKLHPDMVEYRNDRLFLFTEGLSEGEYEYDYYVRVLVPGKFHHLPAVASEMYFPENFGRTRGDYFEIK